MSEVDSLAVETLLANRYRLDTKLGSGGMGTVFRGFDLALKRPVAIKIISQEQRLDLLAKERFVREARMLSSLNHPSICQIYDLVESPDGDAIVLELISGVTLAEQLKLGLSQREKLQIAAQLAQALAVAHDQDIIHRDLKPENIMVESDLSVKILDFGLAKPVESPISLEEGQSPPDSVVLDGDTNASSTQVGTIVGTPRYMSPEQAKGEPLTTSSDIFSLGLVYQFLFTGKNPYRSNLSSIALLWKIANADTRPVTGLSPDLTDLIQRMKHLTHGSRPAARDVEKQIKWIQDGPKRRAKKLTVITIMAILGCASLISFWGLLKARKAEALAQVEAQKARETLEIIDRMFASADPGGLGRDVKVRDLLDQYAEDVSQLSEDPDVQANLLRTFGLTYEGLGVFDVAQRHFQQAYKLRLNRFGPDHAKTQQALVDLAYGFLNLGQPEQTIQWLKPRLKKLSADPTRSAIDAWSALASAYSLDGQKQLAQSTYQHIYQHLRQSLGPNHQDTIGIAAAYGATLFDYGYDVEAQKLLETALQGASESLGPSHPTTLGIVSSLASLYQEIGLTDQGLDLHRSGLERCQELWGSNHPETIAMSQAYLDSLIDLQRFEEAEPTARALLDSSLAVYGEHHLNSQDVRYTLAQILAELGADHRQEADNLFQQAYSGYADELGADNPFTQLIRAQWLGYLAQWGSASALAEMVALVDQSRANLDREDPVLRDMTWLLADTYRARGEDSAARPLLQQLYNQARQSLGEHADLTQELKAELDEVQPTDP